MTPVRAADWGPLVINTDVDEMVLGMLSLWLPTSLRQIQRERPLIEPFDLPKDESYANTLDDDEFPEHILPAVIVTSANTEGTPEKDGDGFYDAAWNVVVSCIVRGRTPAETRAVAALFEGSVRRVMVQADPTWDGEVRWVASNTAAVADPTGAGRYLAAGMGTYLVYVDKAVQAGAGPAGEPYEVDPATPDEPFEDLIKVGSVGIDVQGRSPTSDLGE